MEIRPIVGWRNPQWEFIVNPIVDLGFGRFGDIDFVPAARLARTFGKDLAFGLEYYTDLGRPGSFLPFEQQSHQLFGVVDFKVGDVDVDFGLGYGLTPGSDRFVAKTILTYALPVAGKPEESAGIKAPPNLRSSTRQTSAIEMASDPFAWMR